MSILKMPRYGGKVVGFNALDSDDRHVRALLGDFRQYQLLDDRRLSEEAYAYAVRGANTLWARRYKSNNQHLALVEEAEVLEDVEMGDAEGCFDVCGVAGDNVEAEIEEVVEPDVEVDTADVADEEDAVAEPAVLVDPFNYEFIAMVMEEEDF
jgi:hypothetical protein